MGPWMAHVSETKRPTPTPDAKPAPPPAPAVVAVECVAGAAAAAMAKPKAASQAPATKPGAGGAGKGVGAAKAPKPAVAALPAFVRGLKVQFTFHVQPAAVSVLRARCAAVCGGDGARLAWLLPQRSNALAPGVTHALTPMELRARDTAAAPAAVQVTHEWLAACVAQGRLVETHAFRPQPRPQPRFAAPAPAADDAPAAAAAGAAPPPGAGPGAAWAPPRAGFDGGGGGCGGGGGGAGGFGAGAGGGPFGWRGAAPARARPAAPPRGYDSWDDDSGATTDDDDDGGSAPVALAPAPGGAAALAATLDALGAAGGGGAAAAAPAAAAAAARPGGGPNAGLVAAFEGLQRHYRCATDAARSDRYREREFARAAKALRTLDFPIATPRDCARAFRALGWDKGSTRCRTVTDFVARGGVCQRLVELSSAPRQAAAQDLQRVFGVGPRAADALLASGVASVEALRARVADGDDAGAPNRTLTRAQRVGLRHADDFGLKIPRDEADRIVAAVKAAARRVAPGVLAEAMGSYRRGLPHSGDVDVLLSHDDEETRSELLPLLVHALSVGPDALITDSLVGNKDANKPDGCQTWMGVVRLAPGCPFRRLDLKVYPREYMPYALLYFTGSGLFNRSIRFYAKRRGLSLSDKGLVAAMGYGSQRRRAAYSTGFVATCEADIFAALGLAYVPPEGRNM